MYENIIAFLLGKKTELTEEDLNKFMELLVKALNVDDEYEVLEKQEVIENIVDSVAVKDRNERSIISNAIENILHFEDNEDILRSEDYDDSEEENIFVDKSEGPYVPLKDRKLRRGEFGKSRKTVTDNDKEEKISADISIKRTKTDELIDNPDKIFKLNENTEYPDFDFEIGELEDNQNEGPEFEFKLDE